MLYTLNILQFYLPILSQTIVSLLVTIHDMIYIYWCLQRKTKKFVLSTEKGKMENFSMLKSHLSKRINNYIVISGLIALSLWPHF